jgi:Fic family protein
MCMEKLFKEIETLAQEINNRRPLDPYEIQQIKEYYRIGLTYTSNALEGNSLTETETKIVLEDGITIGGKSLKDHFEAVGHSQAYDYIYTLINQQKIAEADIKQLHHLFYYRINEQEAGAYRTVKVFLSGSQYALPLPHQVAELMQHFIEQLARNKNMHPVAYAAWAHKELVFIHPFIDGNGRVARLLMNLLLLQHGYTLVTIPPIMRRDYVAALEKAHTQDAVFTEFIATMLKEGQKEYLRLFAA